MGKKNHFRLLFLNCSNSAIVDCILLRFEQYICLSNEIFRTKFYTEKKNCLNFKE